MRRHDSGATTSVLTRSRRGRTAAPASTDSAVRPMPHGAGRVWNPSTWRGPLIDFLKVAVLVGIWFLYLQSQALMLSSPEYGVGPAVTGLAALMLVAIMLVFTYRPRTAPWRTLFWVDVVALLIGTVAAAALGGRWGVAAAMIAGLLVLASRCNSNLRRAIATLRRRRDMHHSEIPA